MAGAKAWLAERTAFGWLDDLEAGVASDLAGDRGEIPWVPCWMAGCLLPDRLACCS
ncbi:hypothetical protein P5P81_20930 [Tritonibacter mobilis]|nr:hypothetical protein [Tritonibacter mobilis]